MMSDDGTLLAQLRIDRALELLDTKWVWCFGRQRIDPALIREALTGSAGPVPPCSKEHR